MKSALILLLFCFALSLFAGRVWIDPLHLTILDRLILLEIRLPRTLLASLIGATLGLCGAAMQGYLRNPLAESGLLGVSNGAALGAVLAIYGGFLACLPIAAMAGGALAVGFSLLLAGKNADNQTLILAGIAVSSLFGAGVAVALNFSSNPFASMEVIFWLMGSLENLDFSDVLLITPFLVAGWGILFSCGRGLDALSLGERTAQSLGVSLSSLRLRLVLGVALSVGASVAVAGSIGFVGLVVPHIMRPFAAHQPSRLLMLSAVAGAALLLLADIGVRLIPTSGVELRLGVMTALIGAPFFLFLLFKERRHAC